MEQSNIRSFQRINTGGILSLARFVDEHGKAIEYDLLTKTGYTLDDIGGTLSWSSLDSFISNLKSDSALARDLGNATGWEDTVKTNAILADIYDLLQIVNANLCLHISKGKKKVRVKPYPRPGMSEDKHKLGKGALKSVESLRKWIRSKRNG